MESLPLVSAIVTTHNRFDLLQKAVDSIFSQNYKNIEIIVVDDNSDKDSIAYLDKLQVDDRIKHIHISQEESKGGNYARNKGIIESKGELIALLDDDDEWLPDKIEKQVNCFNDETIGFAYCDYYTETDDGERKKVVVDPIYQGDVSSLCFQKIFCTTSMLMIRRKTLFDAGLFDLDLKYWQEYDLCIRLSAISRVAKVNEPLMVLRIFNNDGKRLSNKYTGWAYAVNYIENKYRERIAKLLPQIRTEYCLMVLREKAVRCDKAGLKKEERKALFQIWKITKKPKHFVKFVLNYPYYR